MKIKRPAVTQKPVETIETDLLVYCLPQTKKKPPKSPDVIQEWVNTAFHLGDFSGESSQQCLLYPSKTPALNAKRVLLAGLGDVEKNKNPFDQFENLRKTGGDIAKACEKTKAKTLTIVLPQIASITDQDLAQYLTEGIILGDYRFTKYKKKKNSEKPDYTGIRTFQFADTTVAASLRKGALKGYIAAQAAWEAREMAHEPGNGWTPESFAEYAKNLSTTYGFKYTCLDKAAMEKLGMGGILGVNQGSATPPAMVILEYHPPKATQTLLLVGKGITFDSGGISLKPGAGMEEMKYDMCGGAAVLATMKAVGEEKPDLRIIAIVPATDNMPGGRAIHPGDIVTHFNGVTAEIVNTDAEGRMILADALAYGIQTFSPDGVIDIATLTGAVIIGLGHHHTGLVSNHDRLSEQVIQAGNLAGEPIWRLPLTDDYQEQIKSDIADIKNVGGRPGGSITAAAYLSNFVGKTPWVHLDIAGTAWDFTKKSYVPKGPSGIGVRTFITLIRNWKKEGLK